jgi:hypothetical protein
VGQSQLVVQTTEVGGRQCPIRQLSPLAQLASVVHEARQVASMQSEPLAQSPAVLQVPVGRSRQRPV